FSARELINFNLYQAFKDNPQKALADLHSGLAPKGDENRLFALTELSFFTLRTAANDPIIWRQLSMHTRLLFPASEARRPGESTRDCVGRWISTISRSRKPPSQPKARTPYRWAA